MEQELKDRTKQFALKIKNLKSEFKNHENP